MLPSAKRGTVELNTSSVADIAFLLLSFFLMTTVISTDKGLSVTLPEWRDTPVEQPIHERNIFKIQLNSRDELMVEGDIRVGIADLREDVRRFILNRNTDPASSENPEAAVVSIKADRGTTHAAFMHVVDEVQAAYYKIYAERAGLNMDDYRALNPANPSERAIIQKAKQGVPMNISIAEPASASVP